MQDPEIWEESLFSYLPIIFNSSTRIGYTSSSKRILDYVAIELGLIAIQWSILFVFYVRVNATVKISEKYNNSCKQGFLRLLS